MQITGEVKNILAEESIIDDSNKILLEKLQPIIYDEEQVQYLNVGSRIADAFRTGAALKRQLGLSDKEEE